jgi:hypothetical protein
MHLEELSDVVPVFDYRGYRVELRLSGPCGAYRVRRADGTWRYTLPTVVGGDVGWEWVILQPAAAGELVEVETAPTAETAMRRVDALTA